MSSQIWADLELKAEDVHPNASEAVSNYMKVPRQGYGIRCDECGKIQSDFHTIDPGSTLEIPTFCSAFGSSCHDPQGTLRTPITLADSFVPGSFVLAPIRRNLSWKNESVLWPGIVDFSPDSNSTFCKLGLDKKPTSYFVTLLTPGERWYGGWFSESVLHSIRSQSVRKDKRSPDFVKILSKCLKCEDKPLKSRLRCLSFVLNVDKGKRRLSTISISSSISDASSPSKLWMNRFLEDASTQYFEKGARKLDGLRVWPSAAFKVVYLMWVIRMLDRGKFFEEETSFITEDVLKMRTNTDLEAHEKGGDETGVISSPKLTDVFKWTKNPFQELKVKRAETPEELLSKPLRTSSEATTFSLRTAEC